MIPPFSKCWWVTDQLLAGPAFFAGSELATMENVEALEAAGIRTVISLVGMGEFNPDEDECERIGWEIVPRFQWYQGFVFPNGTAPDRDTMKTMLQWIDVGILGGGKVFVHCASGRGRSGTVVGCWLARHGVAQGQGVLEHLEALRTAANLPLPCPETEEQRDFVRRWRKHQ
jgi:protein tyrosine/serine phosphatase